jgi:hypothetical protein
MGDAVDKRQICYACREPNPGSSAVQLIAMSTELGSYVRFVSTAYSRQNRSINGPEFGAWNSFREMR